MSELVYEFSRVEDRNGNDKMTAENGKHSNPVFIVVAKVGRSAILSYVDRSEKSLTTSTVEEVYIIHNYVKIVTKNTVYTLQPYIREVRDYE